MSFFSFFSAITILKCIRTNAILSKTLNMYVDCKIVMFGVFIFFFHSLFFSLYLSLLSFICFFALVCCRFDSALAISVCVDHIISKWQNKPKTTKNPSGFYSLFLPFIHFLACIFLCVMRRYQFNVTVKYIIANNIVLFLLHFFCICKL